MVRFVSNHGEGMSTCVQTGRGGRRAEDDLKPRMVAEFRHCGWFPVTRAPPTPDTIEVVGNIHKNPDLLSG